MSRRGRGGAQGGNRGGGGAGRGVGRGARGGSAAVYTSASPLVINEVKLRVEEPEMEIFSVDIKGIQEENYYNIMLLDQNNKKKINATDWLLKILQREIRKVMDDTWGASNYNWDGAATAFLLKSRAIHLRDQGVVEIDLPPIGRDEREEVFRLQLSRDKQPVKNIDNAKALLTFRVQQAVLHAADKMMQSTGGIVERGVILPAQNLKGSFGDMMRASIDPDKMDFAKPAQRDAFKRDLQDIRTFFELRRAFEVSAQTYQTAVADKFDTHLCILPKAVVRLQKKCSVIELLSAADAISMGKKMAPVPKEKIAASLAKYESIFKGLVVIKSTDKAAKHFDITGIDDKSAKERTFDCKKSGKTYDIAAFYKEKYNVTLRYPDMPLLCLRSGRWREHCPLELVEIQEQFVNPMDTFLQQKSTNLCRIQPGQVKKLPPAFAQWFFAGAAGEFLKQWGIHKASDDLISISTKVAQTPAVSYSMKGQKGPANVQIRNHAWNMKGIQVYRQIENSGQKKTLIVDLCVGNKNFRPAMQEFMTTVTKTLGRPLAAPVALNADQFVAPFLKKKFGKPVMKIAAFGNELEKAIRDRLADVQALAPMANAPLRQIFQGAILCLPKFSPPDIDLYLAAKHFIEDIHGIPSQGIKLGKSNKLDGRDINDNVYDEYVSKVSLGINIKFGLKSLNHLVADSPQTQIFSNFGRDTIFVGAELSHHGKIVVGGKPVTTSVIGMVGSTDAEYSRFQHVATIQPRGDRQDLIQEAGNLFGRLLDTLKNKDFANIVYWRGGLDWGSFESCLSIEVGSIQEELRKRGINARISVLSCAKRHKLRCVPAGPVPDYEGPTVGSICALNECQVSKKFPSFLIIPHQAIGGSCPIPCRVVVLRNDAGLDTSTWATVANATALMDQVVTLGVSQPVPAYYAYRFTERLASTITFIKEAQTFDEAKKLFGNLTDQIPMMCYL